MGSRGWVPVGELKNFFYQILLQKSKPHCPALTGHRKLRQSLYPQVTWESSLSVKITQFSSVLSRFMAYWPMRVSLVHGSAVLTLHHIPSLASPCPCHLKVHVGRLGFPSVKMRAPHASVCVTAHAYSVYVNMMGKTPISSPRQSSHQNVEHEFMTTTMVPSRVSLSSR